MIAPSGTIAEDSVTVKNIGTTAITYEWKLSLRGDFVESKKSDFVQRFWCHYPRAIILPGEEKQFVFSFTSEKVGMYNEEWELWTEPLLKNQLPILSLSGMSTSEDNLVHKREDFWDQFDTDFT